MWHSVSYLNTDFRVIKRLNWWNSQNEVSYLRKFFKNIKFLKRWNLWFFSQLQLVSPSFFEVLGYEGIEEELLTEFDASVYFPVQDIEKSMAIEKIIPILMYGIPVEQTFDDDIPDDVFDDEEEPSNEKKMKKKKLTSTTTVDEIDIDFEDLDGEVNDSNDKESEKKEDKDPKPSKANPPDKEDLRTSLIMHGFSSVTHQHSARFIDRTRRPELRFRINLLYQMKKGTEVDMVHCWMKVIIILNNLCFSEYVQ